MSLLLKTEKHYCIVVGLSYIKVRKIVAKKQRKIKSCSKKRLVFENGIKFMIVFRRQRLYTWYRQKNETFQKSL